MVNRDTYKIIRDSVHGNIKIDGIFLELMDLPELQRLHWIKQLGFTHLVYPGANHTRLEHSLGTFCVARKMADTLNLGDQEKQLVSIAALLHDIGHGPFSHTLEYLAHHRLHKNHQDIAKDMILGNLPFNDSQHDITVKKVLEKYDVDSQEVASIIRDESGRTELSQIIHGAIDADQMDYLLRDAYYTGVAYGVIDIDRVLQVLCLHKNHVVVKRKGVSAIENILVARALMYSSVYLHKTVRISELMLARAVERASEFPFYQMVDSELLEKLKSLEGFQREVALRIKYRKLFKKTYAKGCNDLTKEEKKKLEVIAHNLVQKEDELADAAGITRGYVIIDIPSIDLLFSEPRLGQNDMDLVDETGALEKLSNVSPLPSALQSRATSEWAVLICSTERDSKNICSKVDEILFG